MSKKHSNFIKKVQIEWSMSNRGRLFRNESGTAWQGVVGDKTIEYIILSRYRMIKFGLQDGSADLIGFEWVDGVPVFASVEIKTQEHKKLSENQVKWIEFVKSTGGRAYVYHEQKNGSLKEEKY